MIAQVTIPDRKSLLPTIRSCGIPAGVVLGIMGLAGLFGQHYEQAHGLGSIEILVFAAGILTAWECVLILAAGIATVWGMKSAGVGVLALILNCGVVGIGVFILFFSPGDPVGHILGFLYAAFAAINCAALLIPDPNDPLGNSVLKLLFFNP